MAVLYYSNIYHFFLINTGLTGVLDQYESFITRNTKDHLAWIIRNKDLTWGVYPTQDTSRKKSGRKESGHEGERSQTRPN